MQGKHHDTVTHLSGTRFYLYKITYFVSSTRDCRTIAAGILSTVSKLSEISQPVELKEIRDKTNCHKYNYRKKNKSLSLFCLTDKTNRGFGPPDKTNKIYPPVLSSRDEGGGGLLRLFRPLGIDLIICSQCAGGVETERTHRHTQNGNIAPALGKQSLSFSALLSRSLISVQSLSRCRLLMTHSTGLLPFH